MQCSKNQHFAQRLKSVFSIHAPLVNPLCVAIGAPLESLAQLMIADTIADAFRRVASIRGFNAVPLFDRWRSLPDPGAAATINPPAQAFPRPLQLSATPLPVPLS